MSRIISDKTSIAKAVDRLRHGQLVAIPTETVYGLGADASNADAVRAIFSAKGRPEWHPLIVHIADADEMSKWAASVPEIATELALKFWPGALTFVLPKRPNVLDAVTGGLDTVALRAPSHPVAQELLREFGGGIAAPSANKFGKVSPTCASHVANDFPSEDILIIDGGTCEVGVESTIVMPSENKITVMRFGGVSIEEITDVIGMDVEIEILNRDDVGKSRAPGMLPSHYAPNAKVLIATPDQLSREHQFFLRPERRTAILSYTPLGSLGLDKQLDNTEILSDTFDGADDFARSLYDYLRRADEHHADAIVVVPPRELTARIGPAIWDRLRKASA